MTVVSAPAFAWPLRVYFEDTDAGGVVYHAAYLCFLERARTEWLRTRGIEQSQLAARHDTLFAISKIEIAFLFPARLDDQLRVSCQAGRVGGASLWFSQDVVRVVDNQTLVTARVRAACLSAGTFRPRPIPKHLLPELCR